MVLWVGFLYVKASKTSRLQQKRKRMKKIYFLIEHEFYHLQKKLSFHSNPAGLENLDQGKPAKQKRLKLQICALLSYHDIPRRIKQKPKKLDSGQLLAWRCLSLRYLRTSPICRVGMVQFSIQQA